MRLPIDAAALESIALTIRSSDPRLETGGALFGPSDGSKVLHAAGPGPRAEHGPRSFLRDLAFTQHEAGRLYQADRSHWIGEWHTHVDVPPTPSDLDLHTYAKHMADRDLGFDRFLALIIAISESQPILAAWILERHGNELILMQAGTQLLDLS
ncbi:Mov34/MPN/PAD-1 family protein [Populibacterium corticicola]|uniref:Mov34/MPN/PAD-1 family protein n=1 Tax=Populibacterium corticicola TaxID=1812826 RepID=A0ABW5XE89_9MICO